VSAHHIVGRDEERKELRHAYDMVQKGHGGIVCLSGDMGLGKTALIDVFLDDLVDAGQQFHVARTRCSESLTEGEACLPWIEAFSTLSRQPSIKKLMRRAAPGWHREITHTGSGHARRMKRELLDFLREVSQIHPLVVILDDFQWSDVSSVDLLAYLSTRLEAARVLILVCYRFGDMKAHRHPFVQIRSDLLTRNVCTELQPGFLTARDIASYLALEYPKKKFPDDYANFLYAKTDGNPLFMREFVRGQEELMEFVRNLTLRRIERISDSERKLLLTASVQGREFDSVVLARSLAMKCEDVEEALRALDEVYGLITRIREEELPDGNFSVRYRFVYGFYQEVCYASLAPSRKAALSASLAEAFLTHYGRG
jgi:predicted ATPase